MIIWNFTDDRKQTLAWLVHDVSHSVFSHVGDFVLWDVEEQEASEQYITQLLQWDEIVMQELSKLDIKLSEIDDYEKYPIADNHWPQLAADRLEYNLSSWIAMWFREISQIKKIYQNISVMINEYGNQELWFSDQYIAEDFWLLSIENDHISFSAPRSIVSMSFIADIIKKMLLNKELGHMDLYSLQDKDVIDMMNNSPDEQVRNMWKYYTQFSEFELHSSKPNMQKYSVSSKCKRRFVDPLISTQQWIVRLSKVSETFTQKRDQHINQPEQWISLDF